MLRHWRALLVLALLAVLAYAPMLNLPLLEDDYPNLWQAQQLGAPADAVALLHNPVFRLRATSFWTMFLLWHIARLGPLLYHLTSLLLHIANTWLLYAICLAWRRMEPAAIWAAAFFAVAEGHQEAVIWFSAINELLQFLFGMAALWCWLRFSRRGNWAVWIAGLASFCLALLSKESAVVLLPLLLLASGVKDWRRSIIGFVPYAIVGAAAVAGVLASRDISFRFNDGSFSLHAPFWITWPRNYFRVLSVWGLAAVAAILLAGDRDLRRRAIPAYLWIGIGLVPYSFLTYSTQIPSRQMYLASAGVGMLAGLAMAHWQKRLAPRREWLAVVAALVVLHNVGYLWLKKRSQFLERAAPTQQLIAFAKQAHGPVWVRCFPRNHFIAEEAVQLGAEIPPSDLIWDDAEATRHRKDELCPRIFGENMEKDELDKRVNSLFEDLLLSIKSPEIPKLDKSTMDYFYIRIDSNVIFILDGLGIKYRWNYMANFVEDGVKDRDGRIVPWETFHPEFVKFMVELCEKSQEHKLALFKKELALMKEQIAKMVELWNMHLGASPGGDIFEEAKKHFEGSE